MKAQSYSDGVCKFRDGCGGKCFLGALIPDSKYKPSLEEEGPASGLLLSRFNSNYKNKSKPFEYEDESFLRGLQNIHDNNEVHFFKEYLIDFANIHELTTPESKTPWAVKQVSL